MTLKITQCELDDIVSKAIGHRCTVEVVGRPKIPGDAGYEMPQEIKEAVVSYIKADRWIEAIRYLRAQTGCSLKAGKEEVDVLRSLMYPAASAAK